MLLEDSTPVTQQELDALEKFLDRIWANLGIDVGFSRHFVDRVNDVRNKKQITIADLKQIYVSTYEKLGTKIMSLGRSLNKKPGEIEAIITQLSTNLNIPFVIRWNPSKQILDFHGITIMRKANFRPNKPGEKQFRIEGHVMFNNTPKGLLEAAKAIREKSDTEKAVYDVVIREVFEVVNEKQLTAEQKEDFAAVMAFVKTIDEQTIVTELSKKTLGSYIKKAASDVGTFSAATGRYADRANRVSDEIKAKKYDNFTQGKKDSETADKFFRKSWKRRVGIGKATDKLTKEDAVKEAAPTYHDDDDDDTYRKHQDSLKNKSKQQKSDDGEERKRAPGFMSSHTRRYNPNEETVKESFSAAELEAIKKHLGE